VHLLAGPLIKKTTTKDKTHNTSHTLKFLFFLNGVLLACVGDRKRGGDKHEEGGNPAEDRSSPGEVLVGGIKVLDLEEVDGECKTANAIDEGRCADKIIATRHEAEEEDDPLHQGEGGNDKEQVLDNVVGLVRGRIASGL